MSMISFHLAYDHNTHKVFEPHWMGTRHREQNRFCSCAGKPVRTVDGRLISYRCCIPPHAEVDGNLYCWRHKRMIEQGKTVTLFPPGPVESYEDDGNVV